MNRIPHFSRPVSGEVARKCICAVALAWIVRKDELPFTNLNAKKGYVPELPDCGIL
jgi:hypothetical protein